MRISPQESLSDRPFRVEERLDPQLKGKPTVVVQYNPWKGGGIIAVNYEARAQGVKRGMRGEQAKQLCPSVVLCSVPMIREKADLTRYRDAGKEVIDVMCKFSECVERASIDEAYVDLTNVVEKRMQQYETSLPPSQIPNTYIVGHSDDSSNDEGKRADGTASWLENLYKSGLEDVDSKKLAVGAVVVEEMRGAVFEQTGFRCSAGIAHNKILAKLAAGMHKPNKQTILPQTSIPQFYSTLPAYKVRNLGGKLGKDMEEVHNVKVMSDLLKFTKEELTKLFNQRLGNWLYNIARGFDSDPVTSRLMPKSIACCKNFPGKMSLSSGKEVDHWLNKLTEELLERLMIDENTYQRKAQRLVFSIRLNEKVAEGFRNKETALSKSLILCSYSHDKIVKSVASCLKKFCTQDHTTKIWSPTITFLGLSAGKFVDSSNKLAQYFNKMRSNTVNTTPTDKLNYYGTEVKVHESHCEDAQTSNESLKCVRSEVSVHGGSTEHPQSSPDLEDSMLNETGPSFFEKLLLSEDAKRDQIKLNVLPSLPKPSPRKVETTKVNEVNKEKLNSEIESTGSAPVSKTKDTVSSLFKAASTKWVDPLEIFPNLESIDDATLQLFPPTYRKKIVNLLEAKFNFSESKPSPNSDSIDKTHSSAVSECDTKTIKNSVSKDFDLSDSTPITRMDTAGPSSFQPDPQDAPKEDVICDEQSATTVICLDCRLSIAVQEYDEHRDYHFALSLQEKEQSDQASPYFNNNTNKPFKRKNQPNKVKGDAKKVRGIESYFKKSV